MAFAKMGFGEFAGGFFSPANSPSSLIPPPWGGGEGVGIDLIYGKTRSIAVLTMKDANGTRKVKNSVRSMLVL